jgi:hypothetical protein
MTTSLNPEYTTNITYNSIFEFAKAQNIYNTTTDVTKECYVDKMVLENILYKDRITKHKESYLITQNIIKEMSTMLADTIKKNHILKQRIAVLERNIQEISITRISTERIRIQNVIMDNKIKDNKMLSPEKKNKVLEEAEKNRNDKNHREQLLKYCLIMFAGFILFGLINYL